LPPWIPRSAGRLPEEVASIHTAVAAEAMNRIMKKITTGITMKATMTNPRGVMGKKRTRAMMRILTGIMIATMKKRSTGSPGDGMKDTKRMRTMAVAGVAAITRTRVPVENIAGAGARADDRATADVVVLPPWTRASKEGLPAKAVVPITNAAEPMVMTKGGGVIAIIEAAAKAGRNVVAAAVGVVRPAFILRPVIPPADIPPAVAHPVVALNRVTLGGSLPAVRVAAAMAAGHRANHQIIAPGTTRGFLGL